MSAKALQYAENNLGVHEVFQEVVEELSTLDKMFTDLDKAQDQRRALEDDYADREVQLVNEKRGAHPNMSDTRFKSEFKGWERTDEALRELRHRLFEVRSEIQGLEYEVDLLKLRIRVGTARLEELGGYLHYLAAVKQAEKTDKRQQEKSE